MYFIFWERLQVKYIFHYLVHGPYGDRVRMVVFVEILLILIFLCALPQPALAFINARLHDVLINRSNSCTFRQGNCGSVVRGCE